MIERSWDDCIMQSSAISSSKDIKKSESLTKIAQGRINFLAGQDITKDNANYVFEGYYTSILEIIHAFIIKAGYKVSNHVCLGYYLRDMLKQDALYRTFDDLRFKRNSLVYYGSSMAPEVAKDTIKKSKKFIKDLKKLNTHL